MEHYLLSAHCAAAEQIVPGEPMFRRFVVFAFVVVICGSSSAQKPDQIREVSKGKIERITGSVTKTIRGKLNNCVVKSVFNVVQTMRYQCTSYAKLPFCAKGPASQHCPTQCNTGRWVVLSTREEFLREIVTNCNPLGPPQRAY